MLPWARLDEEGFLEMFRCGTWKSQYCHNTGQSRRCGDWCPLFRNMTIPIITQNETKTGKVTAKGIGFYLVCQGHEKSVFIMSKVWCFWKDWEEIDEYGNVKEPSGAISPAIRKLDLED